MIFTPSSKMRLGALCIAWLPSIGLSVALPLTASAAVLDATQVDLAPLAKMSGHPRLFIDAAGVAELRRAILDERRGEWLAFRKIANDLTIMPPFQYKADRGEQLWQRIAGNRLATLSFAWLITQDQRFLEAAISWAKAICAYPTWGIDEKTGVPFEKGLAAGHQLLGLAMLYDYAGDALDPETRKLIKETIHVRAARASAAHAKGTTKGSHSLLQNHTWIYATGNLASGLALYGEDPDAADWIRLPLAILHKSDAMLSPDGASQEGYGYWEYGVEYLQKLIELARTAGFAEGTSRWWDHTADYGLAMTIPRASWTAYSTHLDASDSARYSWYGPDCQLRWLARRNRDGVAQWLADALVKANVAEQTSPWLSLIWHDPTVVATPPTTKPTLFHFANMGIVSARSDWSGNEALVVFKAGSPLGEFALKEHYAFLSESDLGHVHRDANHFSLFAAGEWLIRNPGYGMREAAWHNTLTVDGKGQLEDKDAGKRWPLVPDATSPRILSVTSTPQVDRILGEAAGAYPVAAGIRSYQRELIFLKPDALVVVDDVAADGVHAFDIAYHPESLPVRQADGSFLAQGKQAVLRLDPLVTGEAGIGSDEQEMAKVHSSAQDASIHAVHLTRKTDVWRSAVALTWAARGGPEPRKISLVDRAGTLVIQDSGTTIEVAPRR
jgi:Heparinase II/III-like protein/Domain of unknown function (DUF4962)